jgi:GMP synthase-like glutamine amidotransferase
MSYCVIETGRMVESLQDEYGTYPDMLQRLLEGRIPNVEFDVVSVVNGETLPSPGDYAGYVIMGSKFSVYDELPWILPLLDFAAEVAYQQIPQVGVCFGHQLMAKALGGQVAPASTGWRLGNEVYRVSDPYSERTDEVVAFSYHQDQVLAPPQDVAVIVSGDDCAYGGFIYEKTPGFSVQFHPEFRPSFLRELVAATSERLPDPNLARLAMVDLERPTNSDRFAEAIARSLTNRAPEEIVGALLGHES